MTKFAESQSKDLKAAEFVGKNLKVRIASVTIQHFDANGDQAAQDKPRLTFAGKEKGLILNSTNTQALVKAYGSDSETWVGHEIGLTTKDYSDKGYGHGWIVTPLDVKAPDFNDDIPF
jgi:F0F1-type ATP synthase alpha subunit